MTFSKCIFNDVFKDVSTRGTLEYCKLHPRVPRDAGWEPLR